MNYSGIKTHDVANGIGIRVSLFVSGCTHHCKGCFNPETWDFCYGEPFTEKEEEKIIEALAPSFIKGFSLLGGEPFEPQNQKALLPLLEKIKKAYPEKDIWCYTGYTMDEELLKKSRARTELTDKMLAFIDVLVDGEFVEDEKDLNIRFRGSRNQRIIDVKETLKTGKLVLAREYYEKKRG